MTFAKAVVFVLTLATIWGVTYMHDRAFRYDIVAAGAGSGGSGDTTGTTEITAFIIDHQTGAFGFPHLLGFWGYL